MNIDDIKAMKATNHIGEATKFDKKIDAEKVAAKVNKYEKSQIVWEVHLNHHEIDKKEYVISSRLMDNKKRTGLYIQIPDMPRI